MLLFIKKISSVCDIEEKLSIPVLMRGDHRAWCKQTIFWISSKHAESGSYKGLLGAFSSLVFSLHWWCPSWCFLDEIFLCTLMFWSLVLVSYPQITYFNCLGKELQQSIVPNERKMTGSSYFLGLSWNRAV